MQNNFSEQRESLKEITTDGFILYAPDRKSTVIGMKKILKNKS